MRIKYDQAKGWSSHFTLLIKAILASRGPVAEVGAGFFSTPLLHWMCKSLGRLLITYENEREFYKFAKNFQDKGHKVKFIENWDKMDFRSRKEGEWMLLIFKMWLIMSSCTTPTRPTNTNGEKIWRSLNTNMIGQNLCHGHR